MSAHNASVNYKVHLYYNKADWDSNHCKIPFGATTSTLPMQEACWDKDEKLDSEAQEEEDVELNEEGLPLAYLNSVNERRTLRSVIRICNTS